MTDDLLEVGRILLHDWDPIGVRELPGYPQDRMLDEYGSYAETIVSMIEKGTSNEDLTGYLPQVEVEWLERQVSARREGAVLKLITYWGSRRLR